MILIISSLYLLFNTTSFIHLFDWWIYKLLYIRKKKVFINLLGENKRKREFVYHNWHVWWVELNFLGSCCLQGNHACNVEASEIQVHISHCHSLCIHPYSSIFCCYVLGLWWPTPHPCQRLRSPSPECMAWRCSHFDAHSPGPYIFPIWLSCYKIRLMY